MKTRAASSRAVVRSPPQGKNRLLRDELRVCRQNCAAARGFDFESAIAHHGLADAEYAQTVTSEPPCCCDGSTRAVIWLQRAANRQVALSICQCNALNRWFSRRHNSRAPSTISRRQRKMRLKN